MCTHFSSERINRRSEPVVTSSNSQRSESGVNVSQEEHDRLLAMHLAHDLNEDEDIQTMIRQYDKPSLVQRGGNPPSRVDRNVTDSYDIESDHAGLFEVCFCLIKVKDDHHYYINHVKCKTNIYLQHAIKNYFLDLFTSAGFKLY